MASSSSSGNSGVPPGFRFHPTDEELLLYYLKKKVAFEKFDLEVIRDVDLNRVEPWDLQERCRIGAAPQTEWYFFSHKDRKYPTGSRTNRATGTGFWKATGRDKCIRTTYKKIGMRKTLVFYRGRAPHGQKTDWIMHEYRLEDPDDPLAAGNEDGWVVCRVFKKKCFFKLETNGSASQAAETATTASYEQSQGLTLGSGVGDMQQYLNHHQPHYMHHHAEQAMQYWQTPAAISVAGHYAHGQVQDLLQNHRPYEFSVMQGGDSTENEWAVLDAVEGRYGNGSGTAAAAVQQMEEMSGQRGGEMELWGYGK